LPVTILVNSPMALMAISSIVSTGMPIIMVDTIPRAVFSDRDRAIFPLTSLPGLSLK
jgi:hypothetical protein